MYSTSTLYQMYLQNPSRQFDAKVTVGTTDYFKDSIVSFELEDAIVPNDEFIIGTVIPNKLTLQIKTADEIPNNAKIVPYLKMMGGLIWNYITESWEQCDFPWDSDSTELIPSGEFYIDQRAYKNGVYTLTAYDKLITTEQEFVSALTYPTSMDSVMNEICGMLGLTRDTSLIINPAYEIPYKQDGFTIRQVMGYIASAHGASVKLNRQGKLVFVKFNSSAQSILAQDYFKCAQTNPAKTITRVVVTYNKDNEFLEAGTGTESSTMTLYNPYITEVMMTSLLSMYNGFTYQPFSMEWKNYPHLDSGDVINVTLRDNSAVESPIFYHHVVYNGGLRATTTASAKSEQKSEFASKGALTQNIEELNKTTVKQEVPYYGVSFGRENGLKIEKSDGSGMAVFNSDKLAFQVNGVDAIYFDPVAGKYKFNGILEAVDGEFSGTVKAANIDVTDGKITNAQIESLSVDKLEGNAIIGKLIKTADADTYVYIHEQYMECFYGGERQVTLGYTNYDGELAAGLSLGTSDLDQTWMLRMADKTGVIGNVGNNVGGRISSQIRFNPDNSILLDAASVSLPAATTVGNSSIATQGYVGDMIDGENLWISQNYYNKLQIDQAGFATTGYVANYVANNNEGLQLWVTANFVHK